MRLYRTWPLYLLAAITLLALVPLFPKGPFDARTYHAVPGVHLEFPWSGVFMEPFLAPAHMIVGAPDFRSSLLSFSVWIIAVALLAGIANGQRWRRRLLRGFRWATIALIAVTFYTFFMALVQLPSWRLKVDDPDVIVADLHTHTFGSHDGLITAEENLKWHKKHGYQVIAVSEHMHPSGSFAARTLAQQQPDLPGVIPGIEVRTEDDEFLVGLGIRPGYEVPPFTGTGKEYEHRFIADIHHRGGAVVALSWLLEPWHVDELAALGVDGIEIANTGHPDVPDDVQAEALKVSAGGVHMIASTDWHGWGGFARTWTLVRVPGAATLDNQAKARAVLDVLKSGDQNAMIPVVANHIGQPSLLREIFSPAVEFVRYASELSMARLLSWWLWTLAMLTAAHWLRSHGFRPWQSGAAVASLLLGTTLALRAAPLLSAEINGVPHEYAREIGTYAIWIAVAALAAGVWLLSNKRSLKMPVPAPLSLPLPVAVPVRYLGSAFLTTEDVTHDAAA